MLRGYITPSQAGRAVIGVKTCPKCDRARCLRCGHLDVTGNAKRCIVATCGATLPILTNFDADRLRLALSQLPDGKS